MKLPQFARSLRFKLLAASLIVEVAMLALLVGNSLRLIDEHMLRQTRYRIAAIELAYKTAVALPLASRDYATLRDILDGWRQADDTDYLVVADPKGKVLAASGWPEGKPLPPPSPTLRAGETYHVVFPVDLLGQQYGTVHYGLSLSYLEAARGDLLLQGSLIAALELLLTSVILFAVGYWLTRHLAHLAEASGRIAEGAYQTRLRAATNDEVGQLTRNFNLMAEAVEARMTELANHLARQKTILESLGEGVYGLDREGRCVFVNPAALTMLGYGEAEMLGKESHQLIHHAYRDGSHFPAAECPVHQTCCDGVTRSAEDWLWRKDGSGFPVAIMVTPLFFEGELQGAVVSFRDISEEQKAAEALRDSRDRLDAFINALPDIVVLKDGESRWQTANRAAIDTLRLDGYPWQGKTNRELGDERAEFRVFHAAASQTDEAAWKNRALTLSTEHVHSENAPLRISEVRKMPLFDAQGRPKALMVIARDVTEQKRTEENLHLLNETLEQRVREEVARNMEQERLLIQQSRLAAMGEMIHNIAHHWRQPINALNLVLANIKDAYEFGELDDAYVAQATATGDRLIQQLSTTIDNFRDYFRSEQELQPFALGDAIHMVVNILGPTLENSQLEVAVKLGAPPRVQGYINELTQVVLNMVNNAKDVILTRRSGTGRIVIATGNDAGGPWLTVSDNGGGIPAEILPKIFDPYFTTKEAGTGLGLYMSKMLIEHMNGSIAVENHQDGAKFTVRLPPARAALNPCS